MHGNSRAGARRNIRAHYDLGNAFYARWLDAGMTYSSARFEHPGQPLAEAQHHKYATLARQIGLEARHHVLEIGCGWGAFAEFAAKEIGARVTALTISRAQHDFTAKRLFDAGLADRAQVRLQDYRDVSGSFDRVASIEMFEAVGEAYWPAYFAKIREVLEFGGRAGLQIITIRDELFRTYRVRSDFLRKYIFPGGMLPSERRLREEVERAGLEWKNIARFGQNYADTLAQWAARFEEAWDEIKGAGFDERFRRLWNFYLGYCEAGFRAQRTDVVQLSLARV
jgi:cyclopropane-fatty-acyl-phospholipid synthase